MPFSFLATIAFALLAIGGIFTANLVVLVFTNSQWHVAGVIAAILAAAASYWAQHQYSVAAISRDESLDVVRHSIARLQGYAEMASKAEALGGYFQLAAVVAAVIGAACFWAGMQ